MTDVTAMASETRMVSQFTWLEAGHGAPVVLLHGLLGTTDHWRETVETLSPRWRVIALSLPLFELPADDLSIRSLSAFVGDFLEAERIGPAVVVGNSLGGHVALDLALQRPGHVRALVLTGSSGLFERGFARGVPHRPGSEFVRSKMEEIFYDPELVTLEWVESVRRVVGQRSYALRLLQVSRSAKRYNLEAHLGQIRCPTLLVWGKEDRITPAEVGLRFLQGIGGSEIRFIPNCGHAPMLEQPAVFADLVGEFLESLATAPAGVA